MGSPTGETTIPKQTSNIRELVEALESSRARYHDAANRLADGHPEISERMIALSKQRARFCEELGGMSVMEETRPNWSDPTVGGRWERAEPRVVFRQAETSESRVQSKAREVLENSELDPRMRALVARQETEIRATRRELRALRDHLRSRLKGVVASGSEIS